MGTSPTTSAARNTPPDQAAPPVDTGVGPFVDLKTAKIPVHTGREDEIVATNNKIKIVNADQSETTFQPNLSFKPDQNNVAETAEHLRRLKSAIQYDTALKQNMSLDEGRVAATKDINQTVITSLTKFDPKDQTSMAELAEKAKTMLPPEKAAEMLRRLHMDNGQPSDLSADLFNKITRSYGIVPDRKATDPKGIKEILETVKQEWPPEKIRELQAALHMDPQTGKSDLSSGLFYRYEAKLNVICKAFCSQTAPTLTPEQEKKVEKEIAKITPHDMDPAVRADTKSPLEMAEKMKSLMRTLELHGKQVGELSEFLDTMGQYKRNDSPNRLVGFMLEADDRLRGTLSPDRRRELEALYHQTKNQPPDQQMLPEGKYEELQASFLNVKALAASQQIKLIYAMRSDINEMKAVYKSIPNSTAWTEKEAYDFLKACSLGNDRNGSALKLENLPLPLNIVTYDVTTDKTYRSPVKAWALSPTPIDTTGKSVSAIALVNSAIEFDNEQRKMTFEAMTKAPPPVPMKLTAAQMNEIKAKDAAEPNRNRTTDPDPTRDMAQYLMKLREEMQNNAEARYKLNSDPYLGQSNQKLAEYTSTYLKIDPNTGMPIKRPGEDPVVEKVRTVMAEGLNSYFAAQAGSTAHPGTNLTSLRSALDQIQKDRAGQLSPEENAYFTKMRGSYDQYIDRQVALNTGRRSNEVRGEQWDNDFLTLATTKRTLNYISANIGSWTPEQKTTFKERMENGGYTKAELARSVFEKFFDENGITDQAKKTDFLDRYRKDALTQDEKGRFKTVRDTVIAEKHADRRWLKIESADIEANDRVNRELAQKVADLETALITPAYGSISRR